MGKSMRRSSRGKQRSLQSKRGKSPLSESVMGNRSDECQDKMLGAGFWAINAGKIRGAPDSCKKERKIQAGAAENSATGGRGVRKRV